MNQIEKAKKLVEAKFAGVFDRGGVPYVEHLYRTSSRFDDELKITASILHDLIEDTDVTKEELLQMGFDKEVVEIVDIVTNDCSTYDEFIDKIILSNNKDAIKVKLSDMEDNMDESRLSKIKEEDIIRQKKYKKAYPRLKDALNKE